MQTHLINFDQMPWISPREGNRYKEFLDGKQRIRVIEFSNGFVDDEWCFNGHAGQVLEGSGHVIFSDKEEFMRTGDIFHISKGDKHKVSLGEGDRLLVITFETI